MRGRTPPRKRCIRAETLRGRRSSVRTARTPWGRHAVEPGAGRRCGGSIDVAQRVNRAEAAAREGFGVPASRTRRRAFRASRHRAGAPTHRRSLCQPRRLLNRRDPRLASGSSTILPRAQRLSGVDRPKRGRTRPDTRGPACGRSPTAAVGNRPRAQVVEGRRGATDEVTEIHLWGG